MAVVDMTVNQVKMVIMEKREKMVILVMLVHVVHKDNVLISMGLLDLKVKKEKEEKRYTYNKLFLKVSMFTIPCT